MTSPLWCIRDNGCRSLKIQYSFTCSAQYFAKSRTVEPKLTCTFQLFKKTKVPNRNRQKTRILKGIQLNFFELIYSCGGCYSEFFRLVLFGVEFYYLYRNSEEAFWSRHIRSIRMGTSIPNRHMCLVGTGATFLNRHIRSSNRHPFGRNELLPNRYIHSVRTGATVPNRHVCS